MNSLVTRGSLFDDFFKDIAPGFYVRPLHGDNLPSPSQIKVDVKETESGYTVQAEVPGVAKEDIHDRSGGADGADGRVVRGSFSCRFGDRRGVCQHRRRGLDHQVERRCRDCR